MSEMLSVVRCASLLGIGRTNAFDLIKSGLISDVQRQRRNGHEMFLVPRAAVERFQDRFAYGDALEEGTTLSAAAVATRLRAAGLRTVQGRDGHPKRVAVFERSAELETQFALIRARFPRDVSGSADDVPLAVERLSSPLLARPMAHAGESLLGYLLRIAEENRYKGLQGLGRKTGLTQALARQLGLAGVHAFVSGANPNGSAIDQCRRVAGRPLSRVCVLCLREFGYRRASWDLPLAISCPVHEVLLASRCTCGERISGRSGTLFHCVCGKDYRCLDVVRTPQWVTTLEDVAQLGPVDHAAAEEELDAVAAAHIKKSSGLRALAHLCRLPIGTKLPASEAAPRLDVRRDFRLLETVVKEWPAGFRGLIGPRLAALTAEDRGTLRHYCDGLRGTPLWIALDEIDSVHWQLRVSRPRSQLNWSFGPPSPEHIPLSLLAESYELSWHSACKLFDTNSFLGSALGLGARGSDVSRWVHRDELVIALAVRRDTVNYHDAAKLMGCSAGDVAGFVKGGHLANASTPRRLTRPRVLVADVGQLLAGLRARARSAGYSDGQLVKLSDLRAFEGTGLRRTWLKLMERIRVRSIPLLSLDEQQLCLHSFGVRWIDVDARLRPEPSGVRARGARAADPA